MAQSAVPVTATAASLGRDPAVFLRTFVHLYPGDHKAVADAMDLARVLHEQTPEKLRAEVDHLESRA